MTESWIQSRTDPDVEQIRCEGSDKFAAWPAGHYVVVRKTPEAGDKEFVNNLTLDAALRRNSEGKVDEDTKVHYESASVASVAAMTVRVVGDLFTDPDTGKILDFSGDRIARLDAARRLPPPVLEFVALEIDRLPDNPFGLLKPAKKPAKSSGGSKPPASS